ncbi:MAG TPA: hypothetical protein VLC55_02210, partial [Burkholderiales bacterium]|nr:hypothetical protein [Burkholderiales bacterium]
MRVSGFFRRSGHWPAVLGKMVLAIGSMTWAAAGWAQPAGADDPCGDLSGIYENKASSGSRNEMYLSNILDIPPRAMRIEFSRWPDGMLLRAPLAGGGAYERFLPWSAFVCEGGARVYRVTRSNVSLERHEGQPDGGSNDQRFSFEKAGDGALLVKYSASGKWPFVPLLLGMGLLN